MRKKEKILHKDSCLYNQVEGCSLRINAFYGWLNRASYDEEIIAKRMNISRYTLQQKLKNHEIFNKEQLRQLIFLAKAKAAFHIIYFKSFEERKRVYRETFGREMIVKKRERRRNGE